MLKEENAVSTLVFARTKHGADKVVKVLSKAKITAEAIHGNKSQNARQWALSNFKEGRTKVLVATDIAARGIDISDLALVINYDLPNVPETYVHRIGRTGRASASGISISFCNIEERPYLKDIEKLIKQQIPVVSIHPYADASKEELIPDKKPQSNNRKQQQAKPKNNNNRNNWRSNKPKSNA